VLSSSSSYHDIAGSTEDLSPPIVPNRCSADELLTSASALMDRRSRSVTDVMALCTLNRNEDYLSPAATSPPANTAARTPPLPPTPAHKFLSSLWDFGAHIRKKKARKHRRRAQTDNDSRDRMPSV